MLAASYFHTEDLSKDDQDIKTTQNDEHRDDNKEEIMDAVTKVRYYSTCEVLLIQEVKSVDL